MTPAWLGRGRQKERAEVKPALYTVERPKRNYTFIVILVFFVRNYLNITFLICKDF